MAGIRFENISKKYGDTLAVNHFSLEIPDKEFLVLVGPSGCGKSTVLRMLSGLEEVTEGRIYIGDRLINNVPPKDRNLAMVFQSYALYPHMSVYDNMAFGLSIQKVPKDEIRRRVNEASKILGIEEMLKRKPRQLSGGQRQRVALGRAIVREPAAFLLDEPLSNLDAKLRVLMRAELKKLHQRLETTFVYVTHDQVEATTMADRIAVLDKGILQQVGSPQKLYDEPDNVFVAGFIGSPGMNFFDLKVEGDKKHMYLTSQTLRVPVPSKKASRLEPYTGKIITFGIRPEDIFVKGHVPSGLPVTAEVNAKVDVIEVMGNELFIYMVSGSHAQFLARVDPRIKANMGQDITVVFNMDNMYTFDKDTGKAIVETEAREAKEAVRA